MKEKPEFIGRKYSEEEKEKLTDTLKEWHEEAGQPIVWEIEKTPEELEMIESVNQMVQAELKHLGIDEYKFIAPEHIHFLPADVYKRRSGEYPGKAYFLGTEDTIYLNKDMIDTKVRLLSVLIHETVHHASKHKFYALPGDHAYDARMGYRIRSRWKGRDPKNKLRGFNEIMTDITVLNILYRNAKTLENKFGIQEEDLKGPIYSYMEYGALVHAILIKTAKDRGVPIQQVRAELVRGQFGANILALKHIEKSFGPDALEILSLLQAFQSEEDNKKIEEMIMEFFTTEDESERERLRTEIKEVASTLG